MVYSVKEIFKTLQGEGGQSGRAAVFCRFAGCNLWSGREEDRAQATCTFCDTDFVGVDGDGGGKFADASALARRLAEVWGAERDERFVVFTGGEPLLQFDAALIEAVHAENFFIAVESNGTVAPPPGIDWLCVSPKAGAPLQATGGAELKLVYPQEGLSPERFEALAFEHFFVQPMDGPDQGQNIAAAIAFCLTHPRWRLSLQTHKMIGIP
jgi:7-carboxy-7-deazaguanine synthase (Cx14CxxC type)